MRAIAAALMIAAAPASTAAEVTPGRIEFEVLRNGGRFGAHTYQLTPTADGVRMTERARFRVDFGPLNFYRYEHNCDAEWRAEGLDTLSCRTYVDGRWLRFTGARANGAFVTRGTAGEHSFAPDTPPSLFIHTRFLKDGVVIDTERGGPARLRVVRTGREMIRVNGETIPADRYRIQGTLTMDAWYDDAGRWVRARFNVDDQRIEYRLASPRSAMPLGR